MEKQHREKPGEKREEEEEEGGRARNSFSMAIGVPALVFLTIKFFF